VIGRRGFLGGLLALPFAAKAAEIKPPAPPEPVDEALRLLREQTRVWARHVRTKPAASRAMHHVVVTVNRGKPMHMRIECASGDEALDAVKEMYPDATELSASIYGNPFNGFSWTTWPKAGA
jgi:hypothetical protein